MGKVDWALVAGLSPLEMFAYLQAQGWRETERLGDRGVVLVRDDAPEVELLLPLRRTVADYVQRVREVVDAVADVEGRSPLSVIHDLGLAGVDVIRIRAADNARSDTVSMPAGIEILGSARDMLVAAALANRRPARVFGPSRPVEVQDYIRSVRVGQTEPASLVFTLLSPVPPALQLTLPHLEEARDEGSFERRTVLRLVEALDAVQSATAEAAAAPRIDPFELAVPRGVSAELCEAVAGISAAVEQVKIGVTWARIRPAPVPSRSFGFDRETARVLREAARDLRAKEPRQAEALSGWPELFGRGQTEPQGTVGLRTLVDGRPRVVRVVFADTEYQKVVDAHKAGKTISVEGDLVHVGRLLELRSPRGLVVHEPAE